MENGGDTEKVSDIAVQYFQNMCHCSESVLGAMARAYQDEELSSKFNEMEKIDLIPALATGLSGGIGGKGDVCGVITTSAMIIGMKFGRKSLPELNSKEPGYKSITRSTYSRLVSHQPARQRVLNLLEEFENKFGNITCKGLRQNIEAPDGSLEKFIQTKERVCPKYIREGIKLLIKYLSAEEM